MHLPYCIIIPLLFFLVLTNDFYFPDVWMEEPECLSQKMWITRLQAQELLDPSTPRIPLSACLIVTLLSLPGWNDLLSGYPDQDLIHFFLKGISKGFRIGYNYKECTCKPAWKNLLGAVFHQEIVDQFLQSGILSGSVIGTFPPKGVPYVHINRFWVIPKRHQPHKWRLIVDLSYPKGSSVSDGIPRDLCSLKHITVDHAIQHINTAGPGVPSQR